MMQTMKRGLALFIVLVMCVSFVPVLHLNANASEVNYVYSSQGYIYNWGTRGTVATFLSPNAEDFYEDNNTSYEELSSYSGSDNRSSVPSSDLYRELQSLMKSNHDYINGYSANNDLLKYTDCQNGGGKISSFYSGTSIGPGWGEGGSWNKEHTWPNSKGLSGSDEDDIMMIRPTSTSENSSRGNTAYGKSSGYYNPNSESGGKYDLRGDVARIFLYVYVRWGNTSYAWGTSGVMESVPVLLEWMEADPVDTWELGRNDSVESITGTRNVFVDYPELAFILFDAEIPSDMSTPSGEASGSTQKCNHNNFGAGVVTAPTCTQKGYTTYTCQTAGCGYSYKDNATSALGHKYVGGTCSNCGEAEPAVPTYVTAVEVGKAYKLGLYSTAEYYFTGSITNSYYGATDSNYDNGVDVYLEQANGGYHLYFKNSSNQKQYINVVASGTYRNFTISSTASSVFTWDTTKNALKTTVSGDVCYIGNYGQYSSLNILTEAKLKDTDYIARLYAMSGNSQDTPSTPPTETTPEETTPNTPEETTPSIPDTPNIPDTPAGEHVTASKIVADLITEHGWTGTTTKQQFNLDANVTVKINGGDHSGKAYDNDHIRIYATDSPAGTVTISVPEGYELISVKVSAQTSGTYAFLYVNGTTIDIKNVSTAVSGSSVVLNSVKNGSNGKQVRITAIEVVYTSLAATPDIPEETTPEVTTPVETPEETTPNTPEETTPNTPEETTPNTPEETTPNTPEETTPNTPEETTPSTPEETTPNTPEETTPNTPEETTPGTPEETTPGTPEETTPETPEETTPETPEETTPETPEETTPETPEDDTTPNDGDATENEEHVCEEVSGWKKFWNAFANFFRRLFGQPELCTCGEVINKED